MKNEPKPRSPKNKFRVQFTYKKPIHGIGSASSFGVMDIEGIENHPQFQDRKRTSKKVGAFVTIWENEKVYPEFDWVQRRSFEV